jgi:coproporphyrinogen III oxidase
MCFGIKHEHLVFHKIMRAMMEHIRTTLHIRSVSYCDEMVFLCETKEDMEKMTPLILSILKKFEWKISKDMIIFNPV